MEVECKQTKSLWEDLQQSLYQCFPTLEAKERFSFKNIRVRINFAYAPLKFMLERMIQIIEGSGECDRIEKARARLLSLDIASALGTTGFIPTGCDFIWKTSVADILEKIPSASFLMAFIWRSQIRLNGGTLFHRGILSRNIFLGENSEKTLKAHFIPARVPPLDNTSTESSIFVTLKERVASKPNRKVFNIMGKTFSYTTGEETTELICSYKFQYDPASNQCLVNMYKETRYITVPIPKLEGEITPNILAGMVRKLSNKSRFEERYDANGLCPSEYGTLITVMDYLGLNHRQQNRREKQEHDEKNSNSLLLVATVKKNQLDIGTEFPDLSDLCDIELV